MVSNIIARTRSSGVTFTPPVTHDMVRSLFDPTVQKSFLEICVILALLSDFAICYWGTHQFGLNYMRSAFLKQYLFWRLCYNLGIGIALHLQSRYETLSNYVKKHHVFTKGNRSRLARFCQFELRTKMSDRYDIHSHPEELNVWLLFRQFVDLILMQDFCTYAIYVYLSLPSQWSAMNNWRTGLGVSMILFNIWVKIDAHRVVKDYAWYWGDFFFLQESELIFDGVFNISPHPMYSIGYMGYYGISLICGDYHVLLVSIWGHLLQFLFLKYVESPHMELIYGNEFEDANLQINSHIDDLIAKKNYDYSRPLINSAFWVINFDKLRFSDYFTVGTSLSLIAWFFLEAPSSRLLFGLTWFVKVISSIIVCSILYLQSNKKWFTKLYLKNGYTQVYSYQQWQFIYNFSTCLAYTFLFIQSLAKLSDDTFIDYTQFIFGILLCAVQIWCNSEIRSAISDFGWFYGDFFLSNYIITKSLTSRGIYRYLNNPETILGVSGVWGTVLMTNFCWENISLACLWSGCNFVTVKFIEQPHMAKLYGDNVRLSGIEKTLKGLKPWRRISDIMDRVENAVVQSWANHQESLVKNFEKPHRDTKSLENSSHMMAGSEEWEETVEDVIGNLAFKLHPNCKFEIEKLNEKYFILPQQITIHWQVPIKLFDENSWIGLYNIMQSRSNSWRTKVSSSGHWSAISPNAYKGYKSNNLSVVNFEKNDTIARGKVTFDSSLLYFESGIYEFRYHCGNSHNVLFASQPFELALPRLDMQKPEILNKQLSQFLAGAGAIRNGKIDYHGNTYFTRRAFQKLVKNSLGVELSSDYMNRVNGDISAISQRICDIKKVLNDLE